MAIFKMFLGLSSPRPTSGLHRPWNAFILNQAARLGKLILSVVRNQLAWVSFPCTKWPFPINSHAGEGFQWLAIEGIEGKTQGQREEEKKQSQGAAKSNRGSFPTSFLLLALYPLQQSISFS